MRGYSVEYGWAGELAFMLIATYLGSLALAWTRLDSIRLFVVLRIGVLSAMFWAGSFGTSIIPYYELSLLSVNFIFIDS